MGPTAAGKTALAVELAELLGCEIVSVDSAMVYRGMDIGTAKPDADTLARAPHRLIDVCDPADSYSAARFHADAEREMAAITAAGGIPLLVGGTGLYFRAVSEGLSSMPSADAAVREGLAREARRDGWAALHQRLESVDPAAALRIHPNDPQRIQRALEVYELTGVPISDWQDRQAASSLPYTMSKLVLAPDDRAVLHARIESRFARMLELGLVEEVRGLYRRGDLHAGLPSMRSVGYRQVWSWLAGEVGEDEMIASAVQATRQLAKRQMTWFRAEKNAAWFDSERPDSRARILAHLAACGIA